jgi:glyoxylase-like metal-dependent hydrolase (beta-lactamase superfamily II)
MLSGRLCRAVLVRDFGSRCFATNAAMSGSGPITVTFFGTASQAPSRSRNVSGAGLQFPSGTNWLVDCGEATQHRARLSNHFRLSRLDAMFITHLHGGEKSAGFP